MAAISLAFSNVERTGFPTVSTVNCLSEKSPTLPTAPESLIARWGLESFVTLDAGPPGAMFHKRGLFNDAALFVAAGNVYTLTTAGAKAQIAGATITGNAYPDVDAALDADYNSIARVATGTGLYKVTSTLITEEDFPTSGGAGASSVAFYKGYWLAQEAGTDAFYYQNPAETTWNALQFASAEYQPDPGVAIRAAGDVVALQNSNSMEIWRATGDAGDPLAPYGGLTFDHGCRSRNSSVNCQGSLIYVDNNCSVRMFSGGDAEIISDNGISEVLDGAAAADLRASFCIKHQHPLYVLHVVGERTLVYDLSQRRWTRFKSTTYDYWRANLLTNVGDHVFATDLGSNKVWKLNPSRLQDESDTFTCEFTALLPADEVPVPIANVELRCEVGGSPRSGQGSAPLIWLQVSYDGGKTWGEKRYRGLGATGEYSTRVRWNALGTARAPWGAMFRFGVSDPVVRRISGVIVNAP